MFNPRMRVEALKRYKGIHPVNTSLDTRSSRENSAVAENSKRKWKWWKERDKVMEMEDSQHRGVPSSVNDGGRGLFYSLSPSSVRPGSWGRTRLKARKV